MRICRTCPLLKEVTAPDLLQVDAWHRPYRFTQPNGCASARSGFPNQLDLDGQFACHHGAQFNQAVAVTPLVVVPGNYFDHAFFDNHSQVGIYDGRELVALVVDGDERNIANIA